MNSPNPYQNLFWDMLESARNLDASDIHIQPDNNSVLIRFRVFGEMVEWKIVEGVHCLGFLQESKRLSQCSIAVSGRAQDARISVPKLNLDVRVNLVPCLYGEKIVLRLLDQTRSFSLSSIGIEPQAESALLNSLKNKTGVNLLTGPTGSGKTTLLYSALTALDRFKLNIVTIEDPVEYSFSGITQIQVSSKLSFSEALRAMLRQDPDVILLGEIRDTETARLCFQAASTGHLVLSTLHANSAAEAATRLVHLDVDVELIRSCLQFSSAQRLLPKLCEECKKPARAIYDQGKSVLVGFGRDPHGCPSCQRGIKGRVPILEFIEKSVSDRTFPINKTPTNTLRQWALKAAQKGMVDVNDALSIQ